MLKKLFILSALILTALIPLSYAGSDSFTVNIPNAQGGYTSIVIQQSGSGYVGPQGEYYPQFPTVAQLQATYNLGTPNSTAETAADEGSNITSTIPPPELPDYDQPDAPGPDYIWVPGYWAYDSFLEDYYWVPGTWTLPPSEGLLWTPGYWYFIQDKYVFHEGYWGDHVGFYGDINYGHGYEGRGFSGGHWKNHVFRNKAIHAANAGTTNHHFSFNGGNGGTNAAPTLAEKAAMKEKHIGVTSIQRTQVQAARNNPILRASENHGKPAIAATVKVGVFKGSGVVAARQAGAFYNKTKPHVPSKPNLKIKVQKFAVKKVEPNTPPANSDNNPRNKNLQGAN